MPNRNLEGGYRYGYQGQYAEKDKETGLNAFELRLWDSRIGRWLTTDPYRQHFSPYMGMGNNPITRVDPDGGCDNPPCNQDEGGYTESTNMVTGEVDFVFDDVWIDSPSSGGTSNYTDILSTGTLLYGIGEGATGTIADFDAVVKALNNDRFLSREFNKAGELRSYNLNPDGTPKYNGGGRGNVKPADVTKAAKKFKLKAGAIKLVKAGGVITNVIGVGLSLHDINQNGLNLSNGTDTVVGAVAFIPPYGWVVSSVYFVGKEMYIVVSGMSQQNFDTFWMGNNVNPSFQRFGE